MSTRDNRDEMVIATKYSAPWQIIHDDKKIQSNYGGNNRKSLVVCVDASLKKLQTTYIDLVSAAVSKYTNRSPVLGTKFNFLS